MGGVERVVNYLLNDMVYNLLVCFSSEEGVVFYCIL